MKRITKSGTRRPYSLRWTKGNPLEVGSTIYSEQKMGDELAKLKGTCTEIIPMRKITFKFDFPTSFMCPKI
ncbi:MAG: hypothetical protein ABFD15_07605 [Methanofastidiosum sp.]